MITKSKYCIQ